MFSQQTVTTEDGKKVLLKSDGTWQYIKPEISKDTTKSFDFRKAKWGMSKKDIKKTEKAKVVRDDNEVLAYDDKVSGMDVLIGYIFINDKLVRSKYVFLNKHTNKNDYISDFGTIKSSIIQKYGEPKEDEKYWNNDLYKNDYDDWGFAISLGHLSYYTVWETPITKIVLQLTGDNYKIDFGVQYGSVLLKTLEEEKVKEKKLDEF